MHFFSIFYSDHFLNVAFLAHCAFFLLSFFGVTLFLCYTLVKLHYFNASLFSMSHSFVLQFSRVFHSLRAVLFHTALIPCCAFSRGSLFSCCTLFMLHFCSSPLTPFTLHCFMLCFYSCFFMLHSVHVVRFWCYTLFGLYFFHPVLFSCCTFLCVFSLFMEHIFRVTLFSCCTFFTLYTFWVALNIVLHFFCVALFSSSVLLMLYIYLYFVLHSFYMAPSFVVHCCKFFVFYFDHVFSCCTFSVLLYFTVAIFSKCAIVMLIYLFFLFVIIIFFIL